MAAHRRASFAVTAGLLLAVAAVAPARAGGEAPGDRAAAARVVADRLRTNSFDALAARRAEEARRVSSARASRGPAGALSGGARLTDFGPNVRVNDPSGDLFSDCGQSGPSIAALGTDAVAVFLDGDGLDRTSPADQLLGWAYSNNHGATWTDGGALPQGAGRPKWQWANSPVVTVNESTGEFYAIGFCYPDGPPGVGISSGVAMVKGTFTAGVFSWGAPQLVLSGLTSQVQYEHPWIAVDPLSNRVYVSYTRHTPFFEDIQVVNSPDGGVTWSISTKLSSAGDDGYVNGSRVAVGPDGEVYVVWDKYPLIDRDLYKLRKSTDGGATFGSEVVAATGLVNWGSGAPGWNREIANGFPRIAVDRTAGTSRGRVYLCWNESVDFYFSDLGSAQSGSISETEPSGVFGQNDNPTRARAFTVGKYLRGTLADVDNDVDFYSFPATFGQTCVFYVDSMSTGLDLDFRIFCGDSTTRLAFSAPGKGIHNLIVWSCPEDGTYYLRCTARPLTSDAGSHRYRIHTAFHLNPGDDRARDTRDVLVASSADGLTWPASGPGAPTRVNDDLARYDNWLPEIAVTSDSRVLCTWYDWRDAQPGTCNGQSNLYLYRSENAGTTWTNLGVLTDATSAWSAAGSNLVPNQGDGLGLFATSGSVYVAWADARDGNPNVYTVPIDITTATLASLSASRVTADRVELDWLAADWIGRPARLERRETEGGWSAIAEDVVGGDGTVRFTDAAVTPGRTYVYRLAFAAEGATLFSSEAEIFVPAGLALALAAAPHPAVGALRFSVTLPDAAAARLTLVDVAGRVVATRDLAGLGAGIHAVTFAAERLPAGLYVARLEHAGRSLTRRVTLVR